MATTTAELSNVPLPQQPGTSDSKLTPSAIKRQNSSVSLINSKKHIMIVKPVLVEQQ